MRIYFDTSAIIPLFVSEPSSQAVATAIEANPGQPCFSDFGVGEVGSAVSHQVRMGIFTASEAISVLAEFDQWSLAAANIVDPESRDIRHAGTIVRRFDLGLRFPDALHLAICFNRGLGLMTRDRQMAQAGKIIGLEVTVLS